MPDVRTEIIPYLFYRDLPAALEWLARAFGFTEEMRTGTPSGGMHGQMMLSGQRIMMGQGAKQWGMASPHETGMATMGVFVYINDDPTAGLIPPATSRAILGFLPRRLDSSIAA
jgi:uncharacterized glyoxalase superfamily protein PhnB